MPLTDSQELGAWLRLQSTPGLGRSGQRRLLAALGEPAQVFTHREADWAQIIGQSLAQALAQIPSTWRAQLERTLQWLDGASDRSILTLGDADYPDELLQTEDPPLLLYLAGRRELLARPKLAIVGSRHATLQGCDNAHSFAKAFSDEGFCVVSGMALGIDAAAHEGGLAGPGSTLAVLGTGLDQIYPKRNEPLARRILEHGLLISEYSIGTPALPAHFPVRNRIIAGLSQGCLVVEAALQSGTLITARMASEAGREVFAIPGSIHAPQSRGCHALLRQGAKLVEVAQDVFEELPKTRALAATPRSPNPNTKRSSMPSATLELPFQSAPDMPRGEAGRILSAMGHDPVSLDALLARGGWPTEQLNAELLDLELDGWVERLPGGLVQRRAQA